MGKINTYSKSQRVAYLDRNAYLTRADHYTRIKGDDVVAYAAQSANVPEATVRGALMGVQQAIAYFVVNGHSVNLGKFGFLRPRLRAYTCVSRDEVSTKLIKGIRLAFRPSKVLQQIVNNIKLSNVVK